MGRNAAPAIDAAVRRVAVAVLAWSHLWWIPGAEAMVYEPAFTAWFGWLGIVGALCIAMGLWRGPAAVLMGGALAVAAASVAREGGEPFSLLPVLAVLAALALTGLGSASDRLALDHWRALAGVELPELFAALRAPRIQLAEPWPLLGMRLAIATLLAVTAWITWLGPELEAERAAASVRAGAAIVLAIPLGSVYARWVRRAHVLVLYDEQCHFCSRTLLWLRSLDTAAIWEMRSESDLPERLQGREDLDRRAAMFAVEGEHAHRGYHAFRHLLHPYRALAGLHLLMGLPGVRWMGERVYAWVAARRGEWFVCALDD